MKITFIAFALCLGMNSTPQTKSFEKQALALVQRMAASDLDSRLPKRPFASWFNETVGPQAGVVWQLTACGEDIGAADDAEQELPACAQVNASLPDGRKVIAVIAVGTFQKGLIGEPVFFRAVIERDNQFYLVNRLDALPGMLREPTSPTVKLPPIAAFQPPVILSLPDAYLPDPSAALNSFLHGANESEAPPPLPFKSPEPQKVSEVILMGNAITKVRPRYPASAKKMNALGTVEVQVTISEGGRVIEATAISGHIALRRAAVAAARKWVFRPTLLRGEPVQVQSTLTFVFTHDDQ
jgi:TonB family protein